MNAHDYQAVIRQLAPDFRVTFQGDASLGGTRTTRAAMAARFDRLFRLLPDARFELRPVAVDGPMIRTNDTREGAASLLGGAARLPWSTIGISAAQRYRTSSPVTAHPIIIR